LHAASNQQSGQSKYDAPYKKHARAPNLHRRGQCLTLCLKIFRAKNLTKFAERIFSTTVAQTPLRNVVYPKYLKHHADFTEVLVPLVDVFQITFRRTSISVSRYLPSCQKFVRRSKCCDVPRRLKHRVRQHAHQ
jgi:hypothetical protein